MGPGERSKRPSVTAHVVAWARALDALHAPVASLASLASLGLTTHMGLRQRAIDDALLARVRDGVRQVVLLGAGLDDRATRLHELRGCRTFEVDHPATQAVKRRGRGADGAGDDAITYVGIDFEREALAGALATAGHDPAARTVWIWEGVTMYLTRPAMEATLASVVGASARGSGLLMTYATIELSSLGLIHPFVRPLFRAIGEPLAGLFAPGEAVRVASAHGLVVDADTGVLEWARAAGRRPPRHVLAERLLVAGVY